MIERMLIMDTRKRMILSTLIFTVFSDTYITPVISTNTSLPSTPPTISSSSFSPSSSSSSTVATAAATTLMPKTVMPLDNDIQKGTLPVATDAPAAAATAAATTTTTTTTTTISTATPVSDMITSDEPMSSTLLTDPVSQSTTSLTSTSTSTGLSDISSTPPDAVPTSDINSNTTIDPLFLTPPVPSLGKSSTGLTTIPSLTTNKPDVTSSLDSTSSPTTASAVHFLLGMVNNYNDSDLTSANNDSVNISDNYTTADPSDVSSTDKTSSFSTTDVMSTTTSLSLDSTSISDATISSTTMSSKVPIIVTSAADVTSSDVTTGDTSPNKKSDCPEKTVFGEYGLLAFLIIAIVCVMLMLILLILVVKVTRRKTNQIPDDEKHPPKLKLIEVRDIGLKNHAVRKTGDELNSSNDGLQTYSLDYEKHVQEKIEEHRRKTRAPSNQSQGQGMSTFMVGKKPSLMSNHSSVSSASSPRSPASPIAEQQALLTHKDEDSPVVFNFTKKPGESLAERRSGNNYDPSGDRRKSNVTAGKKKINTEV